MNLLFCANCTNKDPIVPSADRCPACQTLVDPPNVRATLSDAEVEALEQRILKAEIECKLRGCNSQLEDFSEAVNNLSEAVICRPLGEVQRLVKDNQLYNTFYEQLDGESRIPESNSFDEDRLRADSFLFPYFFKKIVFAALSLNRRGPLSYGPHTLVLKEDAIGRRATVFETNSVTFCKSHDLGINDKVPTGYRASWSKRGLLAKAKLQSQISEATTSADYAGILLQNGSSAKNDDFIEVHIYGGFSRGALKAVSFSETKNRADTLVIRSITGVLKGLGIEVMTASDSETKAA